MNQDTQIIPISETGELVYTQWDQLTLISKQIMNAGITKLGNPTQVNLIILKGRRLGLDIFEALENISVINNKTSINGALASALVERSGKLADKSHVYEGEGDTRKCTVTVQRTGRSKVSWSFSIREAKIAGLYPGKSGSGWSSYPDSMLYWRALGFCYRREFSEVLQGMYLTEELADEVREVKVVTESPPTSVKVESPKQEKTVIARVSDATIPEKTVIAHVSDAPPWPDPDPADTAKAMSNPIISAPSDLPVIGEPPISKNDKPVAKSENLGIGLQSLMELATKDGINHEELLEVVNGLRLFPRGVEHKLEFLPQAKIATLLKNWQVVIGQVERIRKEKVA